VCGEAFEEALQLELDDSVEALVTTGQPLRGPSPTEMSGMKGY
jgi:hypothetical protein